MGSIVSGMLNQTIDRISSTTRDAYGDETKSIVWENVPCRWQHSQSRALSNVLGTAIISVEAGSYTAKAWLYPEYEDIQKEYIITKDDEDYKIMSIEKHYSLEGDLDHIVLVLE